MTWKPHLKRHRVSRSLHGTYPTVYVKAISFSGLCTSSIETRFDQTRVWGLISPRPNLESSLAFLFVTLQERIDVYVKAISFSGLCTSSIETRFDQTRVWGLISPRPNLESSLAFLFVTLQERIDDVSLPVSLRYGSRRVKYTKAAKAKLNHRSKF